MRRIWLAIRVFFLILLKGDVAREVGKLMAQRAGQLPPPEAPKPEVKVPAPKPAPAPRLAVRSEAVTLLAALQREARFVDFIKEPLDNYSDAQIGAAVRDVHRDCAKLLDRLFAIRPIVEQEEGSPLEVPAGFDASRYRLTGNVVGQPPFHGRLMHHGWEAAACQLPGWTGSESAAKVVAPVEVELS